MTEVPVEVQNRYSFPSATATFVCRFSGRTRGIALCLVLGFGQSFEPVSGQSLEMHDAGLSKEQESAPTVFDSLFSGVGENGRLHHIPYPFFRVIERIEKSLGQSQDGDSNSVRTVLIPLSRCINRYAAAPDYFRSPRIVVAVDSENRSSSSDHFPYLKDRLFLGYQSAAKAIEVISYNETTGQFEFQTVTDYDLDSNPVVNSVNHSRCLGCHQNAGPIFSRPPWDETDNNGDLLQKIANAQGHDDEEIILNSRSEAGAFDSATNRANLFPLYQKFWDEGCQSDSWRATIRCRAGLLKLVVQNRLSGRGAIFADDDLISSYLLPISAINFEKRWPKGLSVNSADIVNQNPLVVGEREHLKSADNLRFARASRVRLNLKNLSRLIDGLGQFVPSTEVRKLDQRLFELAAQKNAPTHEMKGLCQLIKPTEAIDIGEQQRIASLFVLCKINGGQLEGHYQLTGELRIRSGVIQSQSGFDRLVLGGDHFVSSVTHRGGMITAKGDRWWVRLGLFEAGTLLHARLPNGDMLDHLTLSWSKSVNTHFPSQTTTTAGEASLVTLRSGAMISDAIGRMIQEAEQGEFNGFSSRTFRGRILFNELLKFLQIN